MVVVGTIGDQLLYDINGLIVLAHKNVSVLQLQRQEEEAKL
jgi:hypothetical protein